MHPNKIIHQIRSFLSRRGAFFFVRYPYEVERPYDQEYRVTWLHLHDQLLFLEMNGTNLLMFCGDLRFHEGKIQAKRAILCMPPKSIHFFVPAEVWLEPMGMIRTETNPTLSGHPETQKSVQSWLHQHTSGSYTILLTDASSQQSYECRVDNPTLVHTGSDYTLVLYDGYLCLWRGSKLFFNIQEASFTVLGFTHAIVLEWAECRFVAHTAVHGSLEIVRRE